MLREQRVSDQVWCGLEEMLPRLRRLLGTLCRDENDVEDALQETLVRAARYRNGLRNRRSLTAWVTCIALNVVRESGARARRSTPTLNPAEFATLLEIREREQQALDIADLIDVGGVILEREDLMPHFGRAFRELRLEDRVLLSSIYIGDRSQAEVAQDRRLSISAVKMRLHRLRRKLRAKIRRSLMLA